MYDKYLEMPVLTNSDKALKYQLELLVMINQKLDKLVQPEKQNEAKLEIVEESVEEIELDKLTKKELIEYAKENEIKIDTRDTKAKIIEAIKK